MSESLPPELFTLASKIQAYFSIEEINQLCFSLGVEPEDIEGNTRQEKARELVLCFHRRKRIPDLLEQVYKERPGFEFPDVPDEPDGPDKKPKQRGKPQLASDIELPKPLLGNSHYHRRTWLILGAIFLAVTVIVGVSWLVRSLTMAECRPPLIQFRISTSGQASVMVIPDSEYQVMSGDALTIETIINDKEPSGRSNYFCGKWTSAGNSRVINFVGCTLQLQTGPNPVSNVITVQVNQRGCATSYVETLFLTSDK